MLWAVAGMLGVLVSVTMLAGRGALTGGLPERLPITSGPGPTAGQAASSADATMYATVAPEIVRRAGAIDQAVLTLNVDGGTGVQQAWRLRTEVLPLAHGLLADVEAYRPADDDVAAVRRSGAAALRATIDGLELYATAYEASDDAAFGEAETSMRDAQRSWAAWQAGITTLAGRR